VPNLNHIVCVGLLGAAILAGCSERATVKVPQIAPEEAVPLSEVSPELLGIGETIAEKVCSQCHATRADNYPSPHPDAPPLRFLAHRYPIENLAEPLAEGIMVNHPDMPEFQFEPRDVEALLAYIESIQVTPDL